MFTAAKSLISRFLPYRAHPASTTTIREPTTDEEMNAVYHLLSENIPYDNFVSRPRTLTELSQGYGLGRAILCAWEGSNLQGAIFFGSAEQEAAAALNLGTDDDAHTILNHVLMIHEIATQPASRRQGIATQLIRAANTWASQRHADISLTVPMNDNSRHLMQQLGYLIAPPTSILVLQIPNGQTYGFPTDENTTYAIQLLTKRKNAHIRARISPPQTLTNHP